MAGNEMSEVVKQTVGRVEDYLRDFGDSFSKIEECCYYAKRGSSLVSIRIYAWDEDAIVHVSANVVKGANLNAELMRMLLKENAQSAFGAFGVTQDGMITFHHTLLGSTLDRPELVNAVLSVSRTSDDWDDRIIAKGGGQTAIDAIRESAKQRSPG